jgi:hypothetical protein
MASPLRVQSIANTSALTSVLGTLSTTPVQGNLLVAAITADVGVTSISVSGFTEAGSIAVGLAGGLALFYKTAGINESGTVIGTATLATFLDMHVYEYSGLANSSPLQSFVTTADSGIGVTSRSGGTTVIAANAPSLTFSAIAQALTNGGGVSWTNSMNVGTTTTHLTTSDLPIFTSVAQNTTASWNTSQRAAGAVVTFLSQPGNSYMGGR